MVIAVRYRLLAGYKKIWHSGGLSTYASHLWLFPDMDVGIYACVNGAASNDDALMAIMYYASDLALGLTPWLGNGDIIATLHGRNALLSPLRVWSTPSTPPSSNLSHLVTQYTGTYGHLAFGNVTVYADRQSVLYLNIGRYGHARLNPTGAWNEFRMRWLNDLEYLSIADGKLGGTLTFVVRNATIDGLKFDTDLTFVRGVGERTSGPGPHRRAICYVTSCSPGRTLGAALLAWFWLVLGLTVVDQAASLSWGAEADAQGVGGTQIWALATHQ